MESRNFSKEGESLAPVLIQGLNTRDKNLLSAVICKKNEIIIEEILARLPVQAIVPLLKELKSRMAKKTTADIAMTWMKKLLTKHAAAVFAQPEATELLNCLLSFVVAKAEAKAQTVQPLTNLQGREEPNI